MVANARRCGELLGTPRDVYARLEVLADEHHTAVWPPPVTWGLIALYAAAAS